MAINHCTSIRAEKALVVRERRLAWISP
uniref:Uncharacterized protein n=1 Tax=Anguilla anguilla TaxID=7936 RepID=A0A0E9PTF2_ANGAN